MEKMKIFLAAAFLLFFSTGAAAQVTVDPDRVRRCLESYIEANRAVLPQARIGFRSLDLPAPFTLPAGELACEVIPADPRILPSRRFTLIFRVDGRVAANLSVRGELEAVAPVVVASGDLARGMVLGEKDLNMVERDLNGLRNPCFDARELIGKTMKRSVRLGDVIDRAAVDFPPTVRRGDVVTITAGGRGLTVSATGLARQDGNEGETITVRNSSSQKDILCRVVGPGAVHVEF